MRAEIRGAALRLFEARGYTATSLRDIANELDVTPAALYYHFRAKDDLLEDLVQPLFDDVQAALGTTPPEQLDGDRRHVLRAVVDALDEHADIVRLLDADIAARTNERVRACWSELLTAIHRLLQPHPINEADEIRAVAATGLLLAPIQLSAAPVERLHDVQDDLIDAALDVARPRTD